MSVVLHNSLAGHYCLPRFYQQSVTFARKAALDLTEITSNSAVWDYAESGDFLYIAADTDGVYVIDLSDPESPDHTTTVRAENPLSTVVGTPITDVVVIGSELFACGRSINFTESNDSGFIIKYDISTPSSPSAAAVYQPDSMSPRPEFSPGYFGNNWYQGMDTDGTYIYIASQFFGLTVLDTSLNVVATVEDSDLQTALGSPSGMYWETSRIAYHGGWVYLANHGNGVIAVDVTTPSSPTNITWYDAISVDGVQLRARNVVADGNYLYMCNNTSGSTNHTQRGLLVMDITSPAGQSSSDWIYEGIHPEDVDTWIGAGDKPVMGIAKHGDYVYLANGQRGTAVFYVGDPTNPVYIGLQGVGIPDATNIYQTYITEKNGKTYAIYGDGKEGGSQKHSVYIDQVIIK